MPEPIEHYEAKHEGIIPALFYKDREGVMRHLTGKCERTGCVGDIGTHDWVTSFTSPGMGFVGREVRTISGDDSS